MRTVRTILAGLSLCTLTAIAGCGGDSSGGKSGSSQAPQPATPTTLVMIAGDGQTGVVGSALSPLEVRVETAQGNPVSGIAVAFNLISGNANLGAATVFTDAAGNAACGLTLASTPGQVQVTATTGLGLVGEPATFTATAAHGPVSSLVVTSAPTSGQPGQVLAATSVELRDALGNLCTTSTDTVGIALASGTGTAGASLTGATAAVANAGAVQFAGLSIDLAGTGYQLELTCAGAMPVLTGAFDIDARAQIAFRTQPSQIEQQGVTWSFFSVEVQDASGAILTGDNASQLSLSLFSGSGNLSGTLTATAEGGLCVFEAVSYDTAETIVVDVNASFATTISAQVSVESEIAAGLQIDRVDVASGGVDGNGQPYDEVISANGRFFAFASDADNLVAGDTNGVGDVFRHDRLTGQTIRVTVGPSGVQANGASRHCSISANGRFVAYRSDASNLVAGDTNGARDIFVHDCETGVTSRVNLGPGGVEADKASQDTSLSGSGRFVAFRSSATNLVVGDTNASIDIFVHDRITGVTTRVSVDSAGNESTGGGKFPKLAADGSCVVFQSVATNLVANDTNGCTDVFVHDLGTGVTERVSVDSTGAQGNGDSLEPSISADGRYVAFQSGSTNFATGGVAASDVFVHDRQTGVTERVSNSSVTAGAGGDFQSEAPDISGDGRYVTFFSRADDLDGLDQNVDWDVFIYDRQLGTTKRVSESAAGVESNGGSIYPVFSTDGRYVVFNSMASNLAQINNAGFHSYVVANQ